MKSISQIEPLIREGERKAMEEYLNSGGWLTEHTKTKEFEKIIADYVGSKYCVVTTSGTVALTLAVMALKIIDEIIVPDFTMIASANAVRLAKAKPFLVDIDPKNLCIDIENLNFTPAQKHFHRAMIFVSLNGRCPEMEKVIELCK